MSDEIENDDGQAGDDGGAQLGDAGKKALQQEREARKAAEQQLAALSGRVEALQRAEAERVAGRAADGFRPLADARDLWKADGVELGAMLDDDGNVDPAKVRETVGGVVADRPHWALAAPRATGSADAGKGAGARTPDAGSIADRIMRGDGG